MTPSTPKPDENVRTTVTEAEFEAARVGDFPNYSGRAEVIYSNGGKLDGYAVDYINHVNGKLVFYSEEMTEGKKTGACGFFRDGTYWCGSYDPDTGKWNVSSNSGYGISYPAEGMPFPLSSLTYDEEKGEYSLLMPGVENALTPEQIAGGWGNITLRFENGKLVKMGRPKNMDDTHGVHYYILTLSDYGTTEVPTPPEADIVFNSNNGTVSPGTGDYQPH